MSYQQQQHFALVSSGSKPLPVPPTSSPEGKKIRSELTDLYQAYADLYPNPKLVDEARQRDTLLQAASAAANFSSSRNAQNKQKKGGFFSRLFGGDNEDDNDNRQQDENIVSGARDDNQGNHSSDPLVYTEIPNEHDDGSLCGTLYSIDLSCIPAEAYNVARFHLASTRHRRDQPNAIRWGPHSPETSFAIVELGVIAEFVPGQPPSVLMTSDREALQDYAFHQEAFVVHNARAAAISANFIAVSWGFIDGIVVLYRRMQFPNINISWEALYMLGPTPPVLENLTGAGGDFFHDDADHPGSPLLRVSDCLPLKVETGDEEQPLVATLALSRLGGYIELVPLPAPLWDGPILTPDNHRRPKPPKRRQGQHYALRVDCLPQTLALTTVEYHVDTICLEAVRTSVTADTQWDRDAFPEAPPSEFILAASGMSSKGYEAVTFWTVSTLFSEDLDISGGGIQFQLHSSLVEAINAETGADVSIFATDGIMKRWRTPRQVALRSDGDISSGSGENLSTQSNSRITTISTTAPIVCMKFCAFDGLDGPFLALLDWNGSVTLCDCAVMQRVSSQSLQPHEYELFRSSHNGGDPFPFMSLIVSRQHFHKTLNRKQAGFSATNVHWLNLPSSAQIDGLLPPLVLLSGNPLKLLIASFSIPTNDSAQIKEPTASIISQSFPGNGAVIESLADGNLSLILMKLSSKGSFLNHILMRQLDPVAIVQSLAKESKFEEAIQATKKLSIFDQEELSDVVKGCHKRLWELKRDVDSLAETRDVSYIVKEAISLCESDSVIDGLSLKKLRLICSLAITMGRNYRPTKDRVDVLRSFLVKLGTFELLCGFFSTEPSFLRFCNEFRRLSVVDLSIGLARRGEVNALTIILFRHKKDTNLEWLRILESIPLSIHPNAFSHLLPVTKNGYPIDSFLNPFEADSVMHLAHLPQFTSENYKTYLVLDQSDEKLTLDSMQKNVNGDNNNREITVPTIADWFVNRATKMQQYVGNVETVVRFCEIGMVCTETPRDNPSAVHEASPAVQRLFATWRSSLSLKRMVMSEIISFETGGSDSRMSQMSTDKLLSMDLVDMVELVLGGEKNPQRLISRCNDYLRPFAMDTALLKQSGGIRDLDDAVAAYCNKLSHNCVNAIRTDKKTGFEAVKTALTCCSAVAATSKTSISKEERLIKNKSILIKMVTVTAQDMFVALDSTELTIQECQFVIGLLWTMYEALPSHIPSKISSSDSLLALMEKVQSLRNDLIAVDILSRWPGCKTFDFPLLRRKEQNNSSSAVSGLGESLVSRMCQSFCSLTGKVKNKDRASLLSDLLSDVKNLNQACFDGSCDVRGLLCKHLVHPLLHMSEFHMLADYLKSKPYLIDREKVKHAVLEFIDNAVFAEDGDMSMIATAIQCQDVIGPVFPDIQAGFTSIRRYLDAAHFIDTVIYEGQGQISFQPFELRRTLPLDVIESILGDIPECVIRGCPQWADRVFARDSNKILRLARSKELQVADGISEPPALPALPGGAIFHLATILGLDDEMSALVVKCRVVTYSVKQGLHGAAAAICRGMLDDGALYSLGDNHVAQAKLGAVAEIVSDDAYGDLSTRRELCQIALSKSRNFVSVCNASALDVITQVSAVLDHRSSRFSREQDLPADRHHDLMSRPIARLYQHIRSEYNADVHALFSDLLGQTSKSVVHDTLMNALSRFTIYWCVSYTKTLKVSRHPIDTADFHEYLALGCSLILHTPSKETSGLCIQELQKIAADQAASVASEERFSDSDGVVVPDAQIVRQLIGRGYSENAALRAVIMTGNQGFNNALGWAVTHTMDEDFNDPVMILKIPGRQYIDENSIRTLQNCLFATGRIIQDPDVMASFLNKVSFMQKSVLPETKARSANIVAPSEQRLAVQPESLESKSSTSDQARSKQETSKSRGNSDFRKLESKESTSLENNKPSEITKIEHSQPIQTPSIAKVKSTESQTIGNNKTKETSDVKEVIPREAPAVEKIKPMEAPIVEQIKLNELPVARKTKLVEMPAVEKAKLSEMPIVEKTKSREIPMTESTLLTKAPVVEKFKLKEMPTVQQVKPKEAPTVQKVKPNEIPSVQQVKLMELPIVQQVKPKEIPTVEPVRPTKVPDVGGIAEQKETAFVHKASHDDVSAPRSQSSRMTELIPPTPPGFPSRKKLVTISSSTLLPKSGISMPINGSESTVNVSQTLHSQEVANGTGSVNRSMPSKTANVLSKPARGPILGSNEAGIKSSRYENETKKSPQPPPPLPPKLSASAVPATPPTRVGPTTRSQSRGLNLSRLDTSQPLEESVSPGLFTPSKLSPMNPGDREELRKRGKLMINQLRAKGSPAEDRRRLIEEGRRLLRESREKGFPTTPTRYTPRARVPPPPPPRTGDIGVRSLVGKPAPPPPRTGDTGVRSLVGKPAPPPPPPPPAPAPAPAPPKIDKDDDDNSGWNFDNFDDF